MPMLNDAVGRGVIISIAMIRGVFRVEENRPAPQPKKTPPAKPSRGRRYHQSSSTGLDSTFFGVITTPANEGMEAGSPEAQLSSGNVDTDQAQRVAHDAIHILMGGRFAIK